MRRPSPALLVALLALFVALGGPAQARRLIDGQDIRKGSIRSAQIRDRSLRTSDLSRGAVRTLTDTPAGSIGAAELAAGAITAGKLAPGAVGGVEVADGTVGTVDLADGAVTGAKLADGTLTTADVARFAGAFRITAEDIGAIAPQHCWSREPRGLAPEQAGADISQDALLVVPRSSFPERTLAFSYRMANPVVGEPASLSRFVLALCNVTESQFTPPASGIAFSYVVFDIPN